jgi:hypothetical protein
VLAGSILALTTEFAWSATALANQPPGGMGGGGMGGGGMGGPGGMGGAPPGGGKEDKKEGPAEAAPKDKGALAPVVSVPAQPEGRRRLQLFELHGNLRMRSDYFHRLDLGLLFNDEDNLEHKFFIPPSEMSEPLADGTYVTNDAGCYAQLTAAGVSQARQGRRCARRRGFGGANMRLRLSPTIHVSDTVKVHAQLDLLDNLVLGSTPDSFTGENPWAPTDLFTRSQYPQLAGVNSFNDSVTVKRAWGEFRFGFGLKLEFGRMGNHWGMGILANDGNGYSRGEKGDIVRMIDTDYGDSVDTVRLSFDFGADKRQAMSVGVSYDWAASGPTTAQLLGPQWASGNLVAQTLSAELYDNVHQLSAWIERHDDASMLRRKLSSGNPVVNYGLKTWMRWQTIGREIGTPGLGDGLGINPSIYPDDPNAPLGDPDGLGHAGVPLGNGMLDEDGQTGVENYSASLVHRRGWILTPDLWLRINWRTMRIEAEGAMVIGNFSHRDLSVARTDENFDIDAALATDRTRIMQFGYALEFKYGLFKDRFHIGVDHGLATGDSSPPYLNQYQSPLPISGGDYSTFGTFRFNPAYVQDLLLFKELMGTVANAGYVKPWAAFYFFQDNFSARLDVEFAGAIDKRGTLAGDKSLWGLEMAGAIRYHDADEPIFFQLQYGAMFPFGAWNAERTGSDGLPRRDDSRAAQTIQAQLGVRF